MLRYKNIIFKYKSILKFYSFNKLSLNKVIWNIRNLFKYVFFFLSKKTFFYTLILFYKLFFYILKIKSYEKKTYLNIYLNYLCQSYFIFFRKFYFLYFILSKNKSVSFYKIYNITFFFLNKNLFFINYLNSHSIFYFLYKNLIFFVYLWLYSIKFYCFSSLDWTSSPIKRKMFVVLRSPHKDKKSREKFQLIRIGKSITLPSFVYDHLLFNSLSNESVLCKSNISLEVN